MVTTTLYARQQKRHMWEDALPSELPGKTKNTGVGSLAFLQESPNPGIKPRSPALQANSLLAELPGKP